MVIDVMQQTIPYLLLLRGKKYQYQYQLLLVQDLGIIPIVQGYIFNLYLHVVREIKNHQGLGKHLFFLDQLTKLTGLIQQVIILGWR